MKSERLTPAATGTLVYLNVETVDQLEQALSRVEPSGGKTLMPIKPGSPIAVFGISVLSVTDKTTAKNR